MTKANIHPLLEALEIGQQVVINSGSDEIKATIVELSALRFKVRYIHAAEDSKPIAFSKVTGLKIGADPDSRYAPHISVYGSKLETWESVDARAKRKSIAQDHDAMVFKVSKKTRWDAVSPDVLKKITALLDADRLERYTASDKKFVAVDGYGIEKAYVYEVTREEALESLLACNGDSYTWHYTPEYKDAWIAAGMPMMVKDIEGETLVC